MKNTMYTDNLDKPLQGKTNFKIITKMIVLPFVNYSKSHYL